jgi:ABC-type bacteriocin/lantibiotic exporter with double-glycine peptidase domain
MFGLAVGALGLTVPYATKLLVDDVYPSRDARLLLVVVLATLGLSVGTAIISGLQGYFGQLVTSRMINGATLLMFDHLQRLPISFFEERHVGEIMARLQDMRTVVASVSSILQVLIVNAAYLILIPPFLFVLNWRLALLSVAAMPARAAIGLYLGRRQRAILREAAEVGAQLSGHQYEALSQIRALKSVQGEHALFRRSCELSERLINLQARAARLSGVSSTLRSITAVLGGAAFTWFAWKAILAGSLSLGSFFAFVAYIAYLTGPIERIAQVAIGFQSTAISLSRVFEYLDLKTEWADIKMSSAPPPIEHRIKGEVVFRNVSLKYGAAGSALRDVSLTIPDGRITAVVGPSGSGKTSLLRLICRWNEPTAGLLLMDGRSIDEYTLNDVRAQVACVWQDLGLIRGTLRENIVFGQATVADTAIADALRVCQLTSLIERSKAGLDAQVSEWGASLSGGERQRIALARALVRNVPLTLLDETTSQLDFEIEAEIVSELAREGRGRTIVIVTHRPAVTAVADHVIVMRNGAVEAEGAPATITQSSEFFRRMRDAAVDANVTTSSIGGPAWGTRSMSL